MSHQPDALSGSRLKIDSRKRTYGAEILLDAVQIDDIHGRYFFILASIAFLASSCVYSWLATPPTGILGSAASKSSCVKARYGTSRSCGMSLRPSRICCATQKASVETPGAIDADQVV